METILVGVDGSETSERAAEVADRLAGRVDAEVVGLQASCWFSREELLSRALIRLLFVSGGPL